MFADNEQASVSICELNQLKMCIENTLLPSVRTLTNEAGKQALHCKLKQFETVFFSQFVYKL
jgi:hypothetical protein